MSYKALRAEIKRLTIRIGGDEPPATLIVLSTVHAGGECMDLPETTGHVLSYRLEGQAKSFFFPFSEMTSDQAVEIAEAIIRHTCQIERVGRVRQVGILDMTFPYPCSIRVCLPPPGASIEAHAASLYQHALEARNERTQSH